MSAKERELYEGALAGHIHGTEEQVAAELSEVAELTGADELLVTTSTYDRTALLDSFGRLARLAGLTEHPDGRADARADSHPDLVGRSSGAGH